MMMPVEKAEELRAKRRVHRLVKTGLLGERLEEEGLTKSDAARWVGVSPSQVSRWLAGTQRPRGRNAMALLELLDGEVR
jgi:predicted transcriptional regulator